MPTASLKLECIGDNSTSGKTLFVPRLPRRQWVAEIIGFSLEYNFTRKFIYGRKDYSNANSVGSRGVYEYFILEQDKFYEVSAPLSWKNSYRYFCTVDDQGKIIEINEESVKQCLRMRDDLPESYPPQPPSPSAYSNTSSYFSAQRKPRVAPAAQIDISRTPSTN